MVQVPEINKHLSEVVGGCAASRDVTKPLGLH